jgi:hypothetical protein
MKGGITYASCKEIGGETSSQKSGARKESGSKEGSGEEGGEKGCFSGEEDRCQEIGRLVLATVDMNRRRLISPPIFLAIRSWN